MLGRALQSACKCAATLRYASLQLVVHNGRFTLKVDMQE